MAGSNRVKFPVFSPLWRTSSRRSPSRRRTQLEIASTGGMKAPRGNSSSFSNSSSVWRSGSAARDHGLATSAGTAYRRITFNTMSALSQKQVLDLKPALRFEQINAEHCERMQEREHRPRSCDDSSRRCDSQVGWDFRKGHVRATDRHGAYGLRDFLPFSRLPRGS